MMRVYMQKFLNVTTKPQSELQAELVYKSPEPSREGGGGSAVVLMEPSC